MGSTKLVGLVPLSTSTDPSKASDHLLDTATTQITTERSINTGPTSGSTQTQALDPAALISAPPNPRNAFPANTSRPKTGTLSSDKTNTYIVFLDGSPGNGDFIQRTQRILNSLTLGNGPQIIFDRLNGFAIDLTEQQAQRLRALSGVINVEADASVFLENLPGTNKVDSLTGQALTKYKDVSVGGEIIPWGVNAVWQGKDLSNADASSTYAFVIDSGVNKGISDLNIAADTRLHGSWITGESPLTDGNGHGTHVAGTIGAKANGQGVIGVAPGAQIVPLKVFDSTGGGASYTSIIAAINHAVKVTQDILGNNTSKVVINMSLAGVFSSSLDSAVKSAASQGFRFAIAAGNSGRDADSYSPAAAGDHPNVFTISAVDSNYQMASFSNWDKWSSQDRIDDVDFAAPGVGILSYNGSTGQLEAWSGTSMASPHVAGLLLYGLVRAGDMTTPYFRGTADPFALG